MFWRNRKHKIHAHDYSGGGEYEVVRNTDAKAAMEPYSPSVRPMRGLSQLERLGTYDKPMESVSFLESRSEPLTCAGTRLVWVIP